MLGIGGVGTASRPPRQEHQRIALLSTGDDIGPAILIRDSPPRSIPRVDAQQPGGRIQQAPTRAHRADHKVRSPRAIADPILSQRAHQQIRKAVPVHILCPRQRGACISTRHFAGPHGIGIGHHVHRTRILTAGSVIPVVGTDQHLLLPGLLDLSPWRSQQRLQWNRWHDAVPGRSQRQLL